MKRRQLLRHLRGHGCELLREGGNHSVTFQATSVEELEGAFRDSVDDYLEFGEERGEDPDKPFSGRP